MGNQIFATAAVLLVLCTGLSSAMFSGSTGSGFLQNVAYPQYCLNVSGPTLSTLTLAPCDLASVYQSIDLRYFNNYATSPWTMTFYANYKVMEVNLGGPYGSGNGASIDLINWNSASTPDTQKWKIVNGVWDGTFQLQSVATTKCLTAEGGSGSGSYMDQWDCLGTLLAPHQSWRIIHWPRVAWPYSYLLKSAQFPGSCLDDSGASSADGATINLYPCTPSAANHHWFMDFTTVAPYGTVLRNAASNKCLQVNGEISGNGVGVTQWTCPNLASAPHHFIWNMQSSDPAGPYNQERQRVQFENVNGPGWCMSEVGGSNGYGGSSQTQPCTNAANQLFYWVQPAEYLKPYGLLNLCSNGPLECLSGSCLIFCQKGATGKPCQTKDDCTSAVCNDGICG